MKDCMKTLFDEEWQVRLYYEGKIKEAFQVGLQIGIKKGILATVVSLMKKGKITETEAAEEAGMTVTDFKKTIAALA